jgi:hypothetical protein
MIIYKFYSKFDIESLFVVWDATRPLDHHVPQVVLPRKLLRLEITRSNNVPVEANHKFKRPRPCLLLGMAPEEVKHQVNTLLGAVRLEIEATVLDVPELALKALVVVGVPRGGCSSRVVHPAVKRHEVFSDEGVNRIFDFDAAAAVPLDEQRNQAIGVNIEAGAVVKQLPGHHQTAVQLLSQHAMHNFPVAACAVWVAIQLDEFVAFLFSKPNSAPHLRNRKEQNDYLVHPE